MTVRNGEPPPSDAGSHPAQTVRRPFGLKAIVVLLILQAMLIFVGLGFLLFAGPEQRIEIDRELRSLTELPASIIGLAFTGPLQLLAAVGLWRLRYWGWVLTMAVITYALATAAISFFRGTPLYPSMFLNVIIVFYLNQQDVQQLFDEPEGTVAA